ncbi:MAG: hypothetical protein K0Q67_2360, partial [Cellvibrio sp.]|nr:hypothetical protein [Cellvibrio sp.]
KPRLLTLPHIDAHKPYHYFLRLLAIGILVSPLLGIWEASYFFTNLRLGLKIINAYDKPIFVAYRFIFFLLKKFFKRAFIETGHN